MAYCLAWRFVSAKGVGVDVGVAMRRCKLRSISERIKRCPFKALWRNDVLLSVRLMRDPVVLRAAADAPIRSVPAASETSASAMPKPFAGLAR